MPVIKSAKKKLRKDRKLTKKNDQQEASLKALIKAAKLSKKETDISKAFQAIDKAAKKGILHKNKANRLKSNLSKLVVKKSAPKTEVKKPVSASKKTSKTPKK